MAKTEAAMKMDQVQSAIASFLREVGYRKGHRRTAVPADRLLPGCP